MTHPASPTESSSSFNPEDRNRNIAATSVESTLLMDPNRLKIFHDAAEQADLRIPRSKKPWQTMAQHREAGWAGHRGIEKYSPDDVSAFCSTSPAIAAIMKSVADKGSIVRVQLMRFGEGAYSRGPISVIEGAAQQSDICMTALGGVGRVTIDHKRNDGVTTQLPSSIIEFSAGQTVNVTPAANPDVITSVGVTSNKLLMLAVVRQKIN